MKRLVVANRPRKFRGGGEISRAGRDCDSWSVSRGAVAARLHVIAAPDQADSGARIWLEISYASAQIVTPDEGSLAHGSRMA
jgi:hypothetical protein